MYGFDQDDSYGYPGGQSFAPIASVASLTLTPAAATHTVGTTQCVDAKLFDTNGAPVPDVRVDFSITGANPLDAASINADAGGNAQLCYPGVNLGDDSITARQGRLSATATKSWVEPIPAPPPAPPLPEGCGLSIDGVDLLGDNAKNALTGTAKTDRLRGSGEADVLNGEASADCLRGDEGDDEISGDDGNDIIRGGADADDIDGGAGDDNIRLQNGDDKVDGGSGDDFIKAQARGTDKVTCGAGKDQVIGDRKDKIADDCEKVKIVNPN
jgi:Ca2+-binding RTX toxin-like protein